MTTRPPISATLIVRNDARLLGDCLARLAWCDEIIVLDMRSTDGSAEIARRYTDQVHTIDPFPIAEPARIRAAELARNDWVLLIDPDEHVPPALVDEIYDTIDRHPNAGALRLPWLFYFKGRRLHGTIWGSNQGSKWMLVHRKRVQLLPLCNRLGRTLDGYDEIRIPATNANHIRHYWSDSYWRLLYKHLIRYARLEARKMRQDGRRFSLNLALVHPFRELVRSLKDFDGWRLGPRGFILSGIYWLYLTACGWLLLAPAGSGHGGADSSSPNTGDTVVANQRKAA